MKPETSRLVLSALLAENGAAAPEAREENGADPQSLLSAVLAMNDVPDETAAALAEAFDAVADVAEQNTFSKRTAAKPDRDTHA